MTVLDEGKWRPNKKIYTIRANLQNEGQGNSKLELSCNWYNSKRETKVMIMLKDYL